MMVLIQNCNTAFKQYYPIINIYHIVFCFSFCLGFPYVISVVTGDKQNAGTDANVFVVLHNGKKKLDSGKVWLSDGKFKRGMTQLFHVNLQVMLSPLTSLEIGHDDSGAAPGWYCEKVIVYCPNTGFEQYFSCNKWFSTSEGDGLIQRTLYENTGMRKKKDKSKSYTLNISSYHG